MWLSTINSKPAAITPCITLFSVTSTMSCVNSTEKSLLLPSTFNPVALGSQSHLSWRTIGYLGLACLFVYQVRYSHLYHSSGSIGAFYHTPVKPTGLCGVSYAGHIGLKGDSEEQPKRSFYWYVAIIHTFEFRLTMELGCLNPKPKALMPL